MQKRIVAVIIAAAVAVFVCYAILSSKPSVSSHPPSASSISIPISRTSAIPAGAVKVTPQTDVYPPIMHSSAWAAPVPLPSTIDTAGGEDSPFIMPDGNTLYFFFTPNVSVPANKQLFDGVTGIYVSEKVNGNWTDAQRVVLEDPGTLALDGCEFVQGNTMWFCSARTGYTGVNLFTAKFVNGRWADWQYAGDLLNKEYQVGEMCLTPDGNEMYFGSSRAGGQGGLDIWVTKLVNGTWQAPENVGAVNTQGDEYLPFITPNGTELWFTRTYMGTPAIYESEMVNGTWSSPQLIISQFAGEPSLDEYGNLYFVHHFYSGTGNMIESDIYVAYHR